MFRFEDIVILAQVGLSKATSHTLSAQGAYTLTRMKAEIDRLYNEWRERSQRLANEVGIEDPDAFDARQEELSKLKKKSKEEQKEWDDNNNKLNRLTELRATLNKEEVVLNCKPMAYDDWHKLKNENKEMQVKTIDAAGNVLDTLELFDFIEIRSEGVIWKAPEE